MIYADRNLKIKVSQEELERSRIKSAVNHPDHYQGIKGLEVFEVLENFLPKYQDSYESYLMGNVIKYVLRAPCKNNKLEDLKKAEKHLRMIIERLEF